MKWYGSLIAVALWQGNAGANAWPRPDDLRDQPAGQLEATVDGQQVVLPALELDVKADVAGDLATVTVTQTFSNPFDKPLHATYFFPLHERAAVYAMTMDVGEERVKAVIKLKDDAAATFEEAKSEGKAAALLTQHRPNMFTQNVANLMPGLPIRVEIKYVQTVPKEDGLYRLVVPLVVGPRYQPKGANQKEPLPEYPDVSGLTIPRQVDQDRVTLRVVIDGGMPVEEVLSPSHKITAEAAGARTKVVTLKSGKTIDNRDFEVRYRLAGDGVKAGMLAHRDGRGGFFSLLIEPPEEPSEAEIVPREMVFVLDTSGSMEGLPLDASKAFMRKALRRLRPKDSFRIIRFSDRASEFASAPLPATPENIRRGIRYTDLLRGEGGTEMTKGIALALDVPPPEGSVRLVTFLTDGYIGNEQQILAMIDRKIGDARLYAFGVGSAVNRYLLGKMGEVGRGFTRYMDPTESVDGVATELAERLDAPVLTNVSIDWGGLAVDGLAPLRIPDLFAGQSVRLQGRYDKPGNYAIKIKGRLGAKDTVIPLQVTLPAAESHGEAIALVWARAMVEDLMDQYGTPSYPRRAGADEDIKAAVVALGLEFGLVTKWTSFVAVSERAYNDEPDSTEVANVPLPMVKGVTESAYGTFDGASTPEPAEWLGFALVLCFVAFVLRRSESWT